MTKLGRRFSELQFQLRLLLDDGTGEAFLAGASDASGDWVAWVSQADLEEDLAHLPQEKHREVAATFCRSWTGVDSAAVFRVATLYGLLLGDNLDAPVDFVVCYSPNYRPGGRTLGAVDVVAKIARNHAIPLINMADRDYMARLKAVVDELNSRPSQVDIDRSRTVLEQDANYQYLLKEFEAEVLEYRWVEEGPTQC